MRGTRSPVVIALFGTTVKNDRASIVLSQAGLSIDLPLMAGILRFAFGMPSCVLHSACNSDEKSRRGLVRSGGAILCEKIEQPQHASALRGYEIAFVAERGESLCPIGAIETGERLRIARPRERTDHTLEMIELGVRDARGLERRSRSFRFAPGSQNFRLFH